MPKLDKDIKFRCYALDSLIAHSGKPLTPDLIGQLTSEILAGAKRIYNTSKSLDDIREQTNLHGGCAPIRIKNNSNKKEKG